MLSTDSILALYYFEPYCGTPLVWIALFFLLRKRVKPVFVILAFISTPIMIIGVLRATYEPAKALAANLAVPSIREAIETQCQQDNPKVEAEEFHWSLDSGYSYSGQKAFCHFGDNPRSWVCECK